MSIKNIPKDTNHGNILEAVQINANGSIIINNLDSYIIEYLMNSIHEKVNFGKKLYCNGVLSLTPEKSVMNENKLNVAEKKCVKCTGSRSN